MIHFLKDSVRNLKTNNLNVGQNSSLLKYEPLFHLHCKLKLKNRRKTLRLIQKRKEKTMKVNMKEWILQYAEQQKEQEKIRSSKSLSQEEKFDPKEKYLNLVAKFLDAK
jgi:hypothetical protein